MNQTRIRNLRTEFVHAELESAQTLLDLAEIERDSKDAAAARRILAKSRAAIDAAAHVAGVISSRRSHKRLAGN